MSITKKIDRNIAENFAILKGKDYFAMVNWEDVRDLVQMTNLNKSLKRFKDLDIHDNSDHEDEHLHDNKGKLEALNTRLTSHV